MLTYAGVREGRMLTYAGVRGNVEHACSLERLGCLLSRQHTPAYVSIRQHTPAYASIRQYTSAYLRLEGLRSLLLACERLQRLLRVSGATGVWGLKLLVSEALIRWRTLTYADAGEGGGDITITLLANVWWRMLTYAGVC